MLVGIIDRCVDEFAANYDYLGHTKLVEQKIDTANAIPIKERARKITFQMKRFVKTKSGATRILAL